LSAKVNNTNFLSNIRVDIEEILVKLAKILIINLKGGVRE